MANIFSIEPMRKVRRTKFHLNHEVKTTARFGELTPILCQEVLPGDTWKLQTEQLIRFAPTLAPTMHRVNAFLHYYFVPNRLLMKDAWEDFISPNGLADEERPELPYIIFDGVDSLSSEQKAGYVSLCSSVLNSRLLDHMGFQFAEDWSEPEGGVIPDCWEDGRLKLPLLPLCAYWLVMQDYYLDENQTDLRRIKKAIGEICKVGECSLSDLILKNPSIDYTIFENDFWAIGTTQFEANIIGFIRLILTLCQRAYEKDYFTSALPTTQRGEEITIGASKITLPEMKLDSGSTTIRSRVVTATDGSAVNHSGALYYTPLQQEKMYVANENVTPPDPPIMTEAQMVGNPISDTDIVDENGDPVGGTELGVTPVTINEFRRAVKLQEFLEKSMRGGYRLIEQIFAHFGVISSNKLLDRPQFLGGASNPVTISEITGTATTDISMLGQYSGHMQSFGGSRAVKFRSEEHGWLFCFLSVLPRTNYCQGIPRQFCRHDRFDFAWPEFAHLGEQEVYERELWFSGASDDTSMETFGYQSRYAEYKYIPSQISGDFKGDLDHWTMARKFANKPTLSNQFIQCSPTDDNNTRIFTIQDDTDYLYCQFYHKILAKRCLPKFGVPML